MPKRYQFHSVPLREIDKSLGLIPGLTNKTLVHYYNELQAADTALAAARAAEVAQPSTQTKTAAKKAS